MARIDWTSATVFACALLMAAAVPGLFAYRVCGHRLAAAARDLVSSLPW